MLTLGVRRRVRRARASRRTALWPRTLIATAAVQNLLGGDEAMPQLPHAGDHGRRRARDPDPAGRGSTPGNTFIDDEVLREAGVTDFAKYLSEGATEESLQEDFYLD